MQRALYFAALVAWWTTSVPAGPPAPALQGVGGPVRCEPAEIPATLVRAGEESTLAIPARNHDAGHPPEGWCGETAIQEAMLFHGAYYPQKLINAAGHPRHRDLYAGEVPAALENLGMEIRLWPDGNPRPDLDGFLAWLRGRIDAGVPVLCGVKINPTRHPEWSLDHFVLAVGHGRDSITFNTTWGRREVRTEGQLRSMREPGFALENPYRVYYGIAIPGPAGRTRDDARVRLFVGQETGDRMEALLKCEGLVPRTRYAVFRLGSNGEKPPAPIHVFEATSTVAGFRDGIDKRRPAIYRCRAMPHFFTEKRS